MKSFKFFLIPLLIAGCLPLWNCAKAKPAVQPKPQTVAPAPAKTPPKTDPGVELIRVPDKTIIPVEEKKLAAKESPVNGLAADDAVIERGIEVLRKLAKR